MNQQNDLVKTGEIIIQSDPNNAWVIVDAGTRRIMRTRAINGQIGEQEIPQPPQGQGIVKEGAASGIVNQSTGTAKIIGEVAEVSTVFGVATGAIANVKSIFGGSSSSATTVKPPSSIVSGTPESSGVANTIVNATKVASVIKGFFGKK